MKILKRLLRRRRRPNYVEYALDLFEQARFGSDTSDTDIRRDFRQVFLGTDQGRRVLYLIVAYTGLYEPAVAPTDPHDLNRAEGRKEVAKHIMALAYGDVVPPKEIHTDDHEI